ncbi:asparagine synthase (glutamine-hydrolyzing) [Flagellimonas aequoris]|uniref:asparagine synthase (glutamine-hydrolyzing) n=1 Tax=Flagellimonas aequoris TaxID=2306997 RepID=A0A418ND15_9FLAO|nr:asparagine synthase (glutamine-hydrolyzing) [Allomuricauda aequoris]RIV74393.1 asparagine synthase (glutamine-hydrolyzing) [Allomuricauda aequoris]TXK08515.1 asparagine synthase (glutamine-hydrolyzing) [Allomuricauda aequoris]
MCGINGIVRYGKAQTKELLNDINLMNDLIIHRGPDDDGVFISDTDSVSVAMGMRRLSIIDLSSGKQPMYSHDNKISIVFNGEIYNYREIKKELSDSGVTFKTTSDTEVILKLYEQQGTSGFKKLDGMFAFSICDLGRGKLFIARDFFGEKPLYYTETPDGLIWCSELKSILNVSKEKYPISRIGLNLFFRLTYIPAPYTIYENVHKLEPNTYLCYDLDDRKINTYQIDDLVFADRNVKKDISLEEAQASIRSLVEESVVSRSIADVPIGTFLSGGVDSSIVSLCLAKNNPSPIETFSIGFKNKAFDETDKSKIVANLIKSNHHEFIIDEKDLEEDVHNILVNFDEPFADSSALPSHLVSNKTKNYVKVALTGDGGDEVFGGYNKYYIGKLNQRYTTIIPKSLHNTIRLIGSPMLKTSSDKRGIRFKMRRMLDSFDYDNQFYWDIISLGFSKEKITSILSPTWYQTSIFEYYKEKSQIKNPKNLTDYRVIDQLISLEGDMLVKVDRTSMLNSLECRAPFLNKSIWKYTMQLPEKYLLNGWNKKFILKEAFKDQFPTDFLNKSKSGFGAPVGDWLKTSLKKELMGYLDKSKIETQGIFNFNNVQLLVENHLNGKEDSSFQVWTYYCFQKWYYTNHS